MAAAAFVVVAGCGGGGGAGTGTRAFDVAATWTVMPPIGGAAGYWPEFPQSQAMTLVWNADAHLVFVGANGQVVARAETAGGAAHRTTETFALPIPFAPSCGAKGSVLYDELTFSEKDGALEGTARGSATYQIGDQVFVADMTATLTGVADVTPPRFTAPAGAAEVDPLAPPAFLPSEPLPRAATASLLGSPGGDVVALVPATLPGAGADQVITGFFVGGTALRSGETYTMKVDGVADFAGHAPAQAPTFTTRAAPPLVGEDGFEGVATPTLGGAGVLRGEPLSPITGTTSLILNTGVGGGFGFLPYMLGPSLAVRLAVSPGDTAVSFQRRIVATAELPSVQFYGTIRVASVGGTVGVGPSLVVTDLAKVTLPRDGDVFMSGVATVMVPLPAGTTNEITFEIIGDTAGCGLPPPSTALIIDDLRVE